MLLTTNEKEIILALLVKERKRIFISKQKKRTLDHAINNINQNLHNIKVNDTRKIRPL